MDKQKAKEEIINIARRMGWAWWEDNEGVIHIDVEKVTSLYFN